MFRLIVSDSNGEKFLEFETPELAKLYRDYHLAFGHWNGMSKWVVEDAITPEEKAFIIDEMTELRNGVVKRVYRISEGIKLKLEEADPSSISSVWAMIRKKRNFLLAETDWTQLPDVNLPVEVRKEYRDYRNYLRVFPSLHNDGSIVSAKVCTLTEWKRGER